MKDYLIWLSKVITILVLVFVCIPLLLGAIIAAAGSSMNTVADKAKKGVAVVEIKGTIMDATNPLKKLYESIADDKVIGVILDIDSPGGAVAPSQQVYAAVKSLKAKKPIVAVMNSAAASGGLYAALGASKILAQPGTLTGSIGVILQLPNFTKIAESVGFQMLTVKSGELKDVGNAFRPVTESDRTFLQASVNEIREHFVTAVVEGRDLDRKEVNAYADGRFLLGSQALEYGLIDDYGTIYDAGRLVYELAEVPLGEDEVPNIMLKEDKLDRIREILESGSEIANIFGKIFSTDRLALMAE